jgi:hypothetical protein
MNYIYCCLVIKNDNIIINIDMADNRLSNPSSVFINSPNVLTIIVNLQTKKKPVQK